MESERLQFRVSAYAPESMRLHPYSHVSHVIFCRRVQSEQVHMLKPSTKATKRKSRSRFKQASKKKKMKGKKTVRRFVILLGKILRRSRRIYYNVLLFLCAFDFINRWTASRLFNVNTHFFIDAESIDGQTPIATRFLPSNGRPIFIHSYTLHTHGTFNSRSIYDSELQGI